MSMVKQEFLVLSLGKKGFFLSLKTFAWNGCGFRQNGWIDDLFIRHIIVETKISTKLNWLYPIYDNTFTYRIVRL